MADQNWGPCGECKWWTIEQDGGTSNREMGRCTEPTLKPYQLRVSSGSGCNHFAPGQPQMEQEPGGTRRGEKSAAPGK